MITLNPCVGRVIFSLLPIILSVWVSRADDLTGTWELLVAEAGIASMHTAVTHFGTVVLLDRTNIGPTRFLLSKPHCRDDINDTVLKHDCYAHFALFDPTTNHIRPLVIQTDTWCSSGQFLPDGTLLQTGGDTDGWKKICKFKPFETSSFCDWEELRDVVLSHGRCYYNNQILPNGEVIIVGGKVVFSLEFYPPRENGVVFLPFLADVEDRQGDNLYHYVHLLPNGNLFIFANNKAILYDYDNNLIVKKFPPLDGGHRNYPSA